MGTKDKRVDAYIAKAGDFAQPILKHLRQVVHKACPEEEETIKWGHAGFMYHGILCMMASFKAHCAFVIWKFERMPDKFKALPQIERTAMGHLGRITSRKDLPSDKLLTGLLKEAMKLNAAGVKSGPKPKSPKKKLVVPDYMLAALRRNKKALATFEELSDSHKREYVEWITEAKTAPTRDRRMETTVEWLSEGKSRNWKYVKK
jgi:uncharacterized protein YdeI (YjbR/CyaY-like superfamily)